MVIRSTLISICLLLAVHECFYHYVQADVYLHNPRGSNNRLNGDKENRANANRVFDSQVCMQRDISYIQGLRANLSPVVSLCIRTPRDYSFEAQNDIGDKMNWMPLNMSHYVIQEKYVRCYVLKLYTGCIKKNFQTVVNNRAKFAKRSS